jgi:hypothetical protein
VARSSQQPGGHQVTPGAPIHTGHSEVSASGGGCSDPLPREPHVPQHDGVALHGSDELVATQAPLYVTSPSNHNWAVAATIIVWG